jgi:hypothetical protein
VPNRQHETQIAQPTNEKVKIKQINTVPQYLKVEGTTMKDRTLSEEHDEDERLRRHHRLADILERAVQMTSLDQQEAAVVPSRNAGRGPRGGRNGGLSPCGVRLRRALLPSSSSSSAFSLTTNVARDVTMAPTPIPQDDQQNDELHLADLLDQTLAPHGQRTALYEQEDQEQEQLWSSAPQLTSTSSLLLPDAEDEDEEDHDDLGDRARLRAVLLHSLAVPPPPPLWPSPQQAPLAAPPLLPDVLLGGAVPGPSYSLVDALRRSSRRDAERRAEEFRRWCEAARSRRVDAEGRETSVVPPPTFPTLPAPVQQEPQGQPLARIVLPRRQSSTSSLTSQARPNVVEDDGQDRSKAGPSADVAGTAILPLDRKDTKRAQAA